MAPCLLSTYILRGTLITLIRQFQYRILYLGVSPQVIAQSFTYQLRSITSASPLYRTFTTTTFSIYTLINIRIYFSSTPTIFNIQTLIINLIGTTLSRYQKGANQALAVILAYKGLVVYIISIPYNFIASLIRLSLFSITFQFLLHLT